MRARARSVVESLEVSIPEFGSGRPTSNERVWDRLPAMQVVILRWVAAAAFGVGVPGSGPVGRQARRFWAWTRESCDTRR